MAFINTELLPIWTGKTWRHQIPRGLMLGMDREECLAGASKELLGAVRQVDRVKPKGTGIGGYFPASFSPEQLVAFCEWLDHQAAIRASGGWPPGESKRAQIMRSVATRLRNQRKLIDDGLEPGEAEPSSTE